MYLSHVCKHINAFVIQCKPPQIKCWGLLTIFCKKRIESRLKTVKKTQKIHIRAEKNDSVFGLCVAENPLYEK